MSAIRRGWVRLIRLVRRSDFEQQIDAEMRYHIEQETADRIRLGMDPDEARRTAHRDFGGVTQQKEAARSARGFPWLDDLGQDLHFALRGLRRAPGASAAAILTLALGVGATTATVSAVNGILLEPMPYPEPDRVVVAWETNPLRRRFANSVAVADFEAWIRGSRSFAGLAAVVPDQQVLDRGRPDRIRGASVSAAWFAVVGVPPALGRGFAEAEATSGAAVIVLSDGLWRDRFGADPAVVGRPVQFQDQRFLVVGVMPRGFRPPAFGWLGPEQRYWIPFAPTAQNRQWGRALLVLGRLRPGVSIAEARSDVAAIMEERARETPESNRGWSATVKGLKTEIVGEVRPPLIVLLVAVAGLLASTTVNVMAITLARIKQRESELALRLALGAGRGRVVRQLVGEALAIALVAAPMGGLLAWLGIQGLAALHPASLPRAENVRMDLAMAGFAVLLAVGATILAAVVPAWRLGRIGLRGFIEAGGRSTRRALGGRLVVAEVAVALVLTVGATLAMRSFAHLRSTSLGFDAERVTALRVSLPSSRYDAAATRTFFAGLAERIGRLPMVERVGLVSIRPLGGVRVATTVFPGDRLIEKKDAPSAEVRVASEGYFRALSMAFEEGRYPEPSALGGERPVVITRSLADLLWPGRSPIGLTVRINLNNGIDGRVAALLPDARLSGPAADPRPALYFPFESAAEGEMDLIVKTRGTEPIASAVQEAVTDLDSSLPVYEIESLGTLVRDSMATDRVIFYLLGGFSLVAILLAAVGVAGVLLVEVGQRRRELGVRLALGADAGELRRSDVRMGLELAGVGVVIGLAAAWYLTRFMRGVLHGVSPADPATFAMVTVTVLGVTLVATFLPAHRATRVDPLEVLRSE